MRIGCCYLLLSIVALGGCQRTPHDAEPATEVASATPVAAADPRQPGPETRPDRPDIAQPTRDTTPVDAKVVKVTLSDRGDTEAHTLGMPRATFNPNDTVYAEIESTGSASDYTLYAKWTAADGTVLSDYGMSVNEPGMKRTVISLSKPDGWPSGTYSIEIAINGAKQQTAKFQVL